MVLLGTRDEGGARTKDPVTETVEGPLLDEVEDGVEDTRVTVVGEEDTVERS